MFERIRHWASVFTGVAVMANRWSPAHRNPKCCPEWFDIMTLVGNYPSTRMKLHNLGIELVYDSGVMVAFCGRLVRHEVDLRTGNRWVWAWFMRDSVHNHFKTPRGEHSLYSEADYAKYSKVEDILNSM
ncbi:uncharacterized protein F5147DRAFT_581632 [Suillus discolor]|uniref:2OGFeDO JBP1/TET oxygenase domain-containing protein n=1 Tax=Suillus discolor TaxID=1912936 RepID=A0A9P7F0F3_9AGAM|nr:uncharacterized protein F5147DRAFT_581632 [Suillus discolor]KAG2101396.1 hypothetical protein F5147DRAFT_581632 [Suillus discolor]